MQRRRGGVEVLVGHGPDFPTGRRVVAKGGPRTDRNDLGASVDIHCGRGAVGFANVAVALRDAVRAEVVVVGRAVGSPDGFSRAFVERRDVLLVNAVKRENQEVVPHDRRGTRSAKVAAGKVAALPDDGGGLRVESGGAVASKVDIDRVVFQHAAWRSIGVDFVPQAFGCGVFEDELMVKNASRAGVDGVHELPLAVGRGGGEPQLAVADDRGRMAKPFQVELPGDVFATGLVPFNGQPAGVAFGGAAVLKGAVSIRPRKFGRAGGPREQDHQEHEFGRNRARDFHSVG